MKKKAGLFTGMNMWDQKWFQKIFKKLKLPLNDNMKYVQKLVLLHLRLIPLTNKNVTDSAFRRIIFEAVATILMTYICFVKLI